MQNAPRLSVSNIEATSGGLPAWIAAVSLSAVIAPTLLTVIHGYFLWNFARPAFMTLSSRAVKGLQNVSVTGVLSVAAVSFDDEFFEPPPPQPARASAPRTTDSAAMTRIIESLLTQDFSLSTFTGWIDNALGGRESTRIRPRDLVRLLDEMAETTPRTSAAPPLLKRLNEQTVLELVRDLAPVSRAEISRRAGISKPTVSLALRSLVEAGLVRESAEAPSGPSYGAVYFEPVPEAALVLGLDLGARFLRGAICDLSGTIRARQDVELQGADAERALAAVAELRDALVVGGRTCPAT